MFIVIRIFNFKSDTKKIEKKTAWYNIIYILEYKQKIIKIANRGYHRKRWPFQFADNNICYT